MEPKLVADIVKHLSDDLRKPEYQGHPNPLHGHCYVASEAYWHLTSERYYLVPHYIRHEGTTHWYLGHINYEYDFVDLTAGQFDSIVPYKDGTPCGFLTRQPSKRAQILIQRVWDDWASRATNKRFDKGT